MYALMLLPHPSRIPLVEPFVQAYITLVSATKRNDPLLVMPLNSITLDTSNAPA